MSLKLKISLILLAVFAGLFAVNAMVLRLVLWPSFEQLELREARQDMTRVTGALQSDAAALGSAAADWAEWDDTYRFAHDRNPVWARSNLVATVFSTYRIEVLFVYDEQGRRLGGSAQAPNMGEPVEYALFPRQLSPDHLLITLPQEHKELAGIIATEHGPLLLAAHRILTSDGKGPSRGFVVMGRLLSDDHIVELAQRVQVPRLERMDDSEIPAGLTPGHMDLRLGEGELRASVSVPVLAGAQALVLHSHIPREITASGSSAINFTLMALVLTVGVVLAAVLAVVQHLAVNPLARLTRHVRHVAESGELGNYLPDERDDEFGYLTREFNRMQWRISRLALHDQLTDLPNRVVFMEHLRRAISRSSRTGQSLAVLHVDLDGFRQINDRYGSAIGDRLLKELAHRLRGNLRLCDSVARFEGDGFTILLEDLADAGRAEVVAEKVLRLLDRPFDLEEHSASVTASIGIAVYPDHAGGADELVLAADVAMYSAKRAGKGRWCLYSDQAGYA